MPMQLWAEQSPPLGNGREGRLSANSQEGHRPNKAQANPQWEVRGWASSLVSR